VLLRSPAGGWRRSRSARSPAPRPSPTATPTAAPGSVTSTGFTARVASGGPGGTIQVRTGSPTGPQLGAVNVPNTGGYGTYTDVSTTLSGGSGALYLVFTGTGSGGLFDVDDFALTGG
jgi:hypothetical protein